MFNVIEPPSTIGLDMLKKTISLDGNTVDGRNPNHHFIDGLSPYL